MSNMIKKKLMCCMVFFMLLGYFFPGYAANCTVNVTNINFGNYDVFNAAPDDVAGNVAVTCNGNSNFSVAINQGLGSGFVNRLMNAASGTDKLSYNLYSDAARSIIWGDGTFGTSVVTGRGKKMNIPVYARAFAQQDISVGAYSDNLTVTVNF